MKRLLSILIVLLSAMCILSAITFSDYSNPKSWIPESLCIGIGNDKWAVGTISYNMDDQLTFSEHFFIEAPAWTFNVNMLSITNRGWREGWSTTDVTIPSNKPLFSGRYDVTQVLFGLPIDLIDTYDFYFCTKPEVGLSFIGNQHYDVLQNTLHKIIKAAPLNVNYEEGNFVKPTLNMFIEAGVYLLDVESTQLILAARADLYNTFDFSSKQIYYGSIGLIKHNFDIITLSLGYSFTQSYSQYKTQSVYHDYLKGMIFSLSINSGFLRIDYTARLQTGFGFGIISVDVLSLFKEPSWQKSNLFLNLGISSQINCTFYNIKIGHPILDSNWSLVASTRFLSGNPSFKGWETTMDPKLWPRYKRSYSAFLIGSRYEFNTKELIVKPYSEITLGIMTWEVRELRNMMVDNDIHSIVNPKLYSFALDLELGLKFIPSGALKSGNSEFQFNIFSGLTAIHNSKEVASYLYYTTQDSEKISTIIPRWGFGIEIGFDLT